MRFSVIIPTIGRESLFNCLGALTARRGTEPEAEIIVAHDRFSAEELRRIRERYPGVTVVAGPGKGPAANRNAGAARATGEWLAFTDDDCLPDANWLSALAKAAATGEADVIEGRTVCRAGLPGPQWHAPCNETGGFLWSCNFAIRAELFRSLRGFDERFPFAHMEDADLKARLEAAGARFRFAPDAVADHPPRLLPGPLALARHHESELMFNLIHYQKARPLRMLAALAKTRARAVLSRGGLRDKALFAGSALVEWVVTVWFCPVWLGRMSRGMRPWPAEAAKVPGASERIPSARAGQT